MRISSHPQHTDYRPDYIYAQVYLDGVKQAHCVFADEDEGVVHVFATDEEGHILPNPNDPAHALEIVKLGVVMIVWVPEEYR